MGSTTSGCSEEAKPAFQHPKPSMADESSSKVKLYFNLATDLKEEEKSFKKKEDKQTQF